MIVVEDSQNKKEIKLGHFTVEDKDGLKEFKHQLLKMDSGYYKMNEKPFEDYSTYNFGRKHIIDINGNQI